MSNLITATIGNTPLLRLGNITPPKGANLLGKQESRNPMGSVKCRIAVAMIEAGIREKKINENTLIVEPTSGNTGLGLAFVCASKNLKLTLTMPESMSMERRQLLRHLGADLILTPASEGMKGAIRKAEEILQDQADSFMPNQFSNPANPEIHRQTTAKEIWRDCGGLVDILVAGVGTGGTITGVSEILKTLNPSLKSVAVEPADSPVLSGGPTGSTQNSGNRCRFYPRDSQPRYHRRGHYRQQR